MLLIVLFQMIFAGSSGDYGKNSPAGLKFWLFRSILELTVKSPDLPLSVLAKYKNGNFPAVAFHGAAANFPRLPFLPNHLKSCVMLLTVPSVSAG